MNFELILPFLRPIEPLLLDESISEILGNPDASWWYERDGIMLRELFNFVAVQERCFAPEEISTLHPWKGCVWNPEGSISETHRKIGSCAKCMIFAIPFGTVRTNPDRR